MRGRALLLGAVLVAGCGGSKSNSASSAPAASGTAPPATTTAQTGAPTTAQTPAPTTPTQPSATSSPASTNTTTATTKTTTTGAINVRVPARFTILASGAVNPPTITIPAHLPVELVVVSTGGAHRITLKTPRPTTLAVPAHGQAEALIDGLRVGGYALDVDGAAKATLTIGGAPGP